MSIDPEKRARIFEAATELFAQFGFRKTSIDEIAGRAGVGKGTVYLVCKNKEDLFYQVVHRELRQWVADLSEHVDPRTPADQLLLACSLLSLQYLEQRPLVRDLMLGNYEEMLPLWVDELEDLRGIARSRNVEILEIGIRQGIFRCDLDVQAIAKILQDLHAVGLLLGYREKRPIEDQARMTRVGLDLLLNGLRTR